MGEVELFGTHDEWFECLPSFQNSGVQVAGEGFKVLALGDLLAALQFDLELQFFRRWRIFVGRPGS
jgi:hypothetical protein